MTAPDLTSGWPFFENDEIEAVVRVLRSGRVNYWTGTEGRMFEQAFAAHSGVDHAVCLANGTVALELALKVLDIGPGDDVVVTSRSFVASAGTVLNCGATPVFADVDRFSQNVTADTIAAVLTPDTKAVIVVHLGGWPCEMMPILELCRAHDICIVEDCAQALGATLHDRHVGSFGDVAAWSFCQDKIMTTGGEGGMLTTNRSDLWEAAWSHRDHGKIRSKVEGKRPGAGYRWVHDTTGSNLRMTEMQSAIGNTALPKVAEWVRNRRQLAAILDEHFTDIDGVRVTVPPAHIGHAYYKYYVFLEPDRFNGSDRDEILLEARKRGASCYTGICGELYREEVFRTVRREPDRLPVARELFESAVMIPLHHRLDTTAVLKTADIVSKVVSSRD